MSQGFEIGGGGADKLRTVVRAEEVGAVAGLHGVLLEQLLAGTDQVDPFALDGGVLLAAGDQGQPEQRREGG